MSQDESAATNPTKDDDAIDRRIDDQPTVKSSNVVLKVVLVLVALVAAYVAFRASAAFFPRWWAQRVADQVHGSFTKGTLWGLFYGFVFTFIPLLLIFQIRRRFFNWTWRLIVVVIGLLLAAPNWLTLSVVAGNSKASHAGERIFDVDAPNFRAGSLIGVIAGVVAAVVLSGLNIMAKRRKEQVKKLKGQLAERDKAAEADD
ncbi:MAG: hypothetical protein JWR83_19 [Aeromicrobium sp.]|nr:hypothetical protein [Aeromicrobium sp.]